MRNPLCGQYNKCLTSHARLGTDFKCDDCRHRHDAGRIPETDLEGERKLLMALFHPGLYRRLEAAGGFIYTRRASGHDPAIVRVKVRGVWRSPGAWGRCDDVLV